MASANNSDVAVSIEKLASHNTASFNCGYPDVDDYLHDKAKRHGSSGRTVTWVAVDPESQYQNTILGFYSIGVTALRPLEQSFSENAWEVIGFVHLAFLGTDLSVQRRGIGDQLLYHALSFIPEIAEKIGIVGVYLMAAGTTAYNWYLNRGFQSLPAGKQHMFMPTSEIRETFRQ